MNEKRRAAIATMVGTTVEWYDFFIYGTAAGLAFPQVFFGLFSPEVAALMAWVVFGVGFLSRPIGAIVFGHYGDTIGRRRLMIIGVMIMGLATFAIGLLPGYAAIGVAAPILLILLRLFQGIAVGGEWGGAVVMAFEHSDEQRRGLWTSFPQMGQAAGLGLGTSVFLVAGALTNDTQFLSWGWRVPFLFSIVVVAIGLYIRLKLTESPKFRDLADGAFGGTVRHPLRTMLTDHWRSFLPAVGSRGGEALLWNTIAVFSVEYIADILHLDKSYALAGILLGCVAQFIMVPIYGHLSDIYGRRAIHATALATLGLTAVPGLYLMQFLSEWYIVAYLFVTIGFIYPAIFSAMSAWFGEQFPTKVRYTGVGLVYQTSGMIYSAWTPLIALALLSGLTPGGWWKYYALTLAGVSLALVCAFMLKDRGRRGTGDVVEE